MPKKSDGSNCLRNWNNLRLDRQLYTKTVLFHVVFLSIVTMAPFSVSGIAANEHSINQNN